MPRPIDPELKRCDFAAVTGLAEAAKLASGKVESLLEQWSGQQVRMEADWLDDVGLRFTDFGTAFQMVTGGIRDMSAAAATVTGEAVAANAQTVTKSEAAWA
jgi:hypothetical protein